MSIFATLLSTAPFAGRAPTGKELNATASMGAGLGVAGRVALMNAVGELLGIPAGGWARGLSRLFVNGDVRVTGMLRRMLSLHYCAKVSLNLARARQYTDIETMLVLATAARESDSSIGASGSRMVDSFREGGLDYLWKEKEKLGLPRAVTSKWEKVPEFVNPESGSVVSPAMIPAGDQVLAYAAQVSASFMRNFSPAVKKVFGLDPAGLGSVKRSALMVWKEYAFLAPGGRAYDPKKTVAAQSGQPFGCVTALEFLKHQSSDVAASPARQLEQLCEFPELNNVEWIRIAKARTAEALFLERLWVSSSELLKLP
ncbi:MAG: hypothetical protein SF187_18725 [Deltaproteobacteria bacterium]|nr:hypothetical protein [Deltaproteobacteria bacterium]